MITHQDEQYMLLAIAKTKQAIEKGQTPFGACIVSAKGDIVVCTHNVVWETTDITAHAEINAIRLACKELSTIDLTGCSIYSTTEPCPMCFSAIHWAKIKRIVYGASIADAQQAGFNELTISNDLMKKEGQSLVEVDGGCLKQECIKLFSQWRALGRAKAY